MLTIHGIGFTASTTYGAWCNWERFAVVPARILHAQVATCVTPPLSESRRVEVTLQLNNAFVQTSATFHFVSVPHLSFFPSLGPVDGGSLILFDGALMIATTWWCRFDQTVVPARRSTGTRLQVR